MNKTNKTVRNISSAKLSLGLLTGVLTVACLPQAGLSAQASALLFGNDYDLANFRIANVIGRAFPQLADAGNGSFQLGRVERIDSVSIELSHASKGVYHLRTDRSKRRRVFLHES